MRSPRFRLPTQRSVVPAAVAAALGGLALGSVGPTAVATAGDLIGSPDIKNDSIVGRDVKNGSLVSRDLRNGSVRGKDIQDGSISASDLDAGLDGVVGPTGPRGDRGVAGPQGVPGADGADGPAGRQADGVATWTVHHDANGQSNVHLISNDSIPDRAVVEPIAATMTGDFGSCDPMWTSANFSEVGGENLVDFGRYAGGMQPWNSSTGRVRLAGPTKLRFNAGCGAGNGSPTALPTFDATLTFQWTVLDPTPTTPFG